MAQQDTRTQARELLGRFGTEGGDLGEMREALPILSEFLNATAAPTFECAMVAPPPAPSLSYPGVEGLEQAWGDWGEAFSTVRAELRELRETEHHLILLVDQIAVTRHDGVEITQPSAMVFQFDDEGQVARAEFHLDQETALRSVGLTV